MESKIIFTDQKIKEAFESLNYSDKSLYKEIERALEDISKNAHCGRNVKKKLILIQKHNLNNLWIYNLRKGWRLIYSIGNNEIEVLAIILDWLSPKDYERLFKF